MEKGNSSMSEDISVSKKKKALGSTHRALVKKSSIQ
jgi:hypothetical protein